MRTSQSFRFTGPTIFACGVLCAMSLGCGGEGRGATSPSSERSDEELSQNSEQATAEAQLGCDDGSCFVCGETICLTGMYCDATAPGGPSCFALGECKQASCDCIIGVLGSGCHCEDASSGPVVHCD